MPFGSRPVTAAHSSPQLTRVAAFPAISVRLFWYAVARCSRREVVEHATSLMGGDDVFHSGSGPPAVRRTVLDRETLRSSIGDTQLTLVGNPRGTVGGSSDTRTTQTWPSRLARPG